MSSKKTIHFSFSCWFIYSLHLLTEFSDFCRFFGCVENQNTCLQKLSPTWPKLTKSDQAALSFGQKKNILKVIERENAWHLLSF